MPLHLAPRGTVAWKGQIEQVFSQHDVDIQRLWQAVPIVPDPQAGIPFTGPISPDRFSLPSSMSSSSHSSRSSSRSSSVSASSGSGSSSSSGPSSSSSSSSSSGSGSSLGPCELSGDCAFIFLNLGTFYPGWYPGGTCGEGLPPGDCNCDVGMTPNPIWNGIGINPWGCNTPDCMWLPGDFLGQVIYTPCYHV